MSAPSARAAGPAGGVRIFEDGIVRTAQVTPIVESVKDPHSVAGEELRLLRARVQGICQKDHVNCIALSSALPGEGKSTVSVGLATALARERGRRVLLIEADLRRPSISETLGLPPAPGLSEWLAGSLDQVPVRLYERGGFFVLAAGQAEFDKPESLGSPLMEALLRSARESFDFVLVDSPPVLPVADTILMQDLLDGFLLVARSRQTPREAILEALGRLRSDKIRGIVLNDHREYRHSYQTYGYERYGMSYGPKTSPGSKGHGKKR
jgi:succinoglycan biosynthesis transport protein ExoP